MDIAHDLKTAPLAGAPAAHTAQDLGADSLPASRSDSEVCLACTT